MVRNTAGQTAEAVLDFPLGWCGWCCRGSRFLSNFTDTQERSEEIRGILMEVLEYFWEKMILAKLCFTKRSSDIIFVPLFDMQNCWVFTSLFKQVLLLKSNSSCCQSGQHVPLNFYCIDGYIFTHRAYTTIVGFHGNDNLCCTMNGDTISVIYVTLQPGSSVMTDAPCSNTTHTQWCHIIDQHKTKMY